MTKQIEPAFTVIWDAARNGYFVNKPNIGTTDCYTRDQIDALLSENARLREVTEKLAEKWERQAQEHGVRTFTGNDHLLFANELRAALSAQEDA